MPKTARGRLYVRVQIAGISVGRNLWESTETRKSLVSVFPPLLQVTPITLGSVSSFRYMERERSLKAPMVEDTINMPKPSGPGSPP